MPMTRRVLSDPTMRASALHYCLAICKIAYSAADDDEQRDELAREAELALLDLERQAAARGLPWEKVTDALGILFLQSLEIYGLGYEVGYARASHGLQ